MERIDTLWKAVPRLARLARYSPEPLPLSTLPTARRRLAADIPERRWREHADDAHRRL